MYFHSPDSTCANRKVEKVCHCYISHNRKHDSTFVQNVFALLDILWLVVEGLEFSRNWVWSDKAAICKLVQEQ